MRRAALNSFFPMACLWLTGAAIACDFEGDKVSVRPERAVEVATALGDAADAGFLDKRLLKARPGDMFAYHKVVRRLEGLRGSLARGMPHQVFSVRPFSVLLVESGLWSRYVPGASDVAMTVHTDGPGAYDAVVLTSEAVIAALAAGTITVDDAWRRGLVVIEDPLQAPQRVSALLTSALAALAPEGSN
jgi:hypothetical protein